jgi:hypothetical protein
MIWFLATRVFAEENDLSLILYISEGGELVQAYCVKCKAKKEMKNTKAITDWHYTT